MSVEPWCVPGTVVDAGEMMMKYPRLWELRLVRETDKEADNYSVV